MEGGETKRRATWKGGDPLWKQRWKSSKDKGDGGLARYVDEEGRWRWSNVVAVSGDDISRWEEGPHFEARDRLGVISSIPLLLVRIQSIDG